MSKQKIIDEINEAVNADCTTLEHLISIDELLESEYGQEALAPDIIEHLKYFDQTLDFQGLDDLVNLFKDHEDIE